MVGVARRAMATAGTVAFLAVPAARREPHGLYHLLRRIDRVHRSPVGVVVLSGHAEVAAALRNPAFGSDERRADESLFHLGPFDRFLTGDEATKAARRAGPFWRMSQRFMLFLDPPDHTRLRRLVSRAFTPRRVRELEPRVASLVDELLDAAAAHERFDVLADVAYPLPARVICELVGVPAEHVKTITGVAPALAVGIDPAPLRTPEGNRRADEAAEQLEGLLLDLVAARRRAPQDDLLSALVQATDDGDRLCDDELVATVALLLLAGHETTANLVGNGLFALARQPEAMATWRGSPELDDCAVEELLRHSGPVQITQRVALEETDLNGNAIRRGQLLVLLLAAANRDPAVFHRPDRLDLARDPNPHVAFGAGAHHCLGAPLARLEAKLVLTAMLRRWPDLRVDTRSARRRPGYLIRALDSLEVRPGG